MENMPRTCPWRPLQQLHTDLWVQAIVHGLQLLWPQLDQHVSCELAQPRLHVNAAGGHVRRRDRLRGRACAAGEDLHPRAHDPGATLVTTCSQQAHSSSQYRQAGMHTA